MEQFFELFGQMALIASSVDANVVRKHMHRRVKLNLAINGRLETLLRVRSFDLRSLVHLVHTCAILGLDSKEAAQIMERVHDDILLKYLKPVGEARIAAEKRKAARLGDNNIEGETEETGCDWIKEDLEDAETKVPLDHDRIIGKSDEILGFEEWVFLVWTMCETNHQLILAEKFCKAILEHRYYSEEADPEALIKNPSSDPAVQESLVKLAWSLCVIGEEVPLPLLYELESYGLPGDALLGMTQPVAYEVARQWRVLEETAFSDRRTTVRAKSAIELEDEKLAMENEKEKNQHVEPLPEEIKSWLKLVRTTMRISLYKSDGPTAAARRRSKNLRKEGRPFPHDTWLSDILIQLRVPHERGYVIDNLHRVPIAFIKGDSINKNSNLNKLNPSQNHNLKACIDVLDFTDLTVVSRRTSGGAKLRRRQLMDQGWIVLETDLKTLWTQVYQKTLRNFVSKMVRNLDFGQEGYQQSHEYRGVNPLAADILDGY